MTRTDPLKLLFLFSDTGGGHRSAAEAIIEAVSAQYGANVDTQLIDFLQRYLPWPYCKFPAIYNVLMRYPLLWGALYHATDGKRRINWLTQLHKLNPFLLKGYANLLRQHPADIVVLTHFFAIYPTLWLKKRYRFKTCVVVTDLVTTHASWFHPEIDHYIVPTEQVKANAIRHGVAAHKIQVLGLPISPRFTHITASKADLRGTLGWAQDKPTALLMGGGDGIGRVHQTVQAIAHAGLDISLVVVTGRNTKLQRDLQNTHWPIPVHIYGFVNNIPALMRAADVLLTKAGPSTLCEGLASGLPTIVYSQLPGQEVGNVDYLIAHGRGCFAKTEADLVAALATFAFEPPLTAAFEAAASYRIATRLVEVYPATLEHQPQTASSPQQFAQQTP